MGGALTLVVSAGTSSTRLTRLFCCSTSWVLFTCAWVATKRICRLVREQGYQRLAQLLAGGVI